MVDTNGLLQIPREDRPIEFLRRAGKGVQFSPQIIAWYCRMTPHEVGGMCKDHKNIKTTRTGSQNVHEWAEGEKCLN